MFRNNLMATFNTLEAAVRWGVPRFVHLSSETVPGFSFPERPFLPDYVPVDEEHPIRPQDPYATAKHFGELLMDGATRRSDLTGVSIRPSWVQWEGNYAENLGPWIREPDAVGGLLGLHRRLRPRRRHPARRRGRHPRPRGRLHRVARHRRTRVARHPHPPLPRRRGAGAPPVGRARTPAGSRSRRRAALLGYDPRRSWRDYLDDAGELRAEARERLQRGETGVERGRRLSGG